MRDIHNLIEEVGARFKFELSFYLASKGDSHKPSQWMRSDIGVQLIDALQDILKVGRNHLLIVQKGRFGNAFAHKESAPGTN
jgi:hypothetical protein